MNNLTFYQNYGPNQDSILKFGEDYGRYTFSYWQWIIKEPKTTFDCSIGQITEVLKFRSLKISSCFMTDSEF